MKIHLIDFSNGEEIATVNVDDLNGYMPNCGELLNLTPYLPKDTSPAIAIIIGKVWNFLEPCVSMTVRFPDFIVTDEPDKPDKPDKPEESNLN